MPPVSSTKWLFKKPILSLFLLVLIWRGGLELALRYTQTHFAFTPTFPYYNELRERMTPVEAVWGHFDGIHYLRLARGGYNDTGTQAFFPVYPLAMRGVGSFGYELEPSAHFLNYVFLGGGLLASYFLSSTLFPALFVLAFPTSFFFGSIYTESLFFGLTMLFFLSLKRRHYFLAAVIAGLASGTRLVGIFLSLSLLVDYFQSQKATSSTTYYLKPIIYFLISLSGFLAYIYFLNEKWHDPLMFFHVQSMFGAERTSGSIVLLPQVLFRYLKMIFTVDPSSLLYQRIWFELVVFVGACLLWFKNLRRIPLSWSLYTSLSLLLPTLTGTLSSVPRYALVLLPFLLPPRRPSLFWLVPSVILLIYCFSLFVRGTFVG